MKEKTSNCCCLSLHLNRKLNQQTCWGWQLVMPEDEYGVSPKGSKGCLRLKHVVQGYINKTIHWYKFWMWLNSNQQIMKNAHANIPSVECVTWSHQRISNTYQYSHLVTTICCLNMWQNNRSPNLKQTTTRNNIAQLQLLCCSCFHRLFLPYNRNNVQWVYCKTSL